MSLKKRIIFIVNPISGTHSKETIPQLIEEKIDHSKYDYSIQRTQYAGHASQIAAEAARDGVDIVVAVGGDGTINEIGRALIHTRTAMGIIPCGSGNGLARHLNIPMIARKALDVINAGTVRTIDYGIIDGHPFFCTCGVGFDAFVSLKFSDSGKRGLLTYLENTLHESLTYQPEIYEIENASGTARYKAFLIACANASQYGNNAYIAPQASLTDGMMDITVLEPFTVLDVPALSFQLFKGYCCILHNIMKERRTHAHLIRHLFRKMIGMKNIWLSAFIRLAVMSSISQPQRLIGQCRINHFISPSLL